MKLPTLPPKIATWSTVSSLAAAVSYADRGTSAIAASSLLQQLHWSESQLGGVQSAFFFGYAITQVVGGVLGGEKSDNERGGYRAVLSASLFFTGLTTILFPIASIHFGYVGASIDRFVLGLFEGLLLPAAMAGVADTVDEYKTSTGANKDYKATASSLLIAGCYLGSAWAYLSAFTLFSEKFQTILIGNGYVGNVWPLVFYVNGVLSFLLLWLYRDEFDILPRKDSTSQPKATDSPKMSVPNDVWNDTISIGKQCLGSKSGRAILVAQIGQGALLYSIASWGPLYLERIGLQSTPATEIDASSYIQESESAISQVAVAASEAAYSLIPSQLTQALVGVLIGSAADQLSNRIGTQSTRRSLQLLSGVVPAMILQYLVLHGGEYSAMSHDKSVVHSFASPVFLFGLAQTISALSLGAVSVSHLDISVPSASGAVYALGNVMAAVSGSVMVNLFGFLLEHAEGGSFSDISTGQEFALPLEIVTALSATGSLFYGLTVDTDLEIGVDSNSTLTATP